MSRKTRKLIWSAPLVAVLAVAGALAMFAALGPGSVFANPLPDAPSNLTVTPATGNDGKDGRNILVVNWDPVTDATGYRVDRSEGGGVWETIPDATEDNPVSQTSYEDDTLDAGETMHYRVFAVNQHGIGRASAPVSGKTAARGKPGPVMNLMAMGTDYKEITLSWEEPDDTGGVDITGYEIQRHVAEAGDIWAHVAIEEDGTSYEHMVHASSDDWIYRVRALNQMPVAVNAGDRNSTANDAHAGEWERVTGNSKPASPPSSVTGLTAVNTGTAEGEISLYWYAPVNNGGVDVSHYIVQARLTGNNANVDWADFADVDETTELGNISSSVTLNADPTSPATPSYTIRIPAPATGRAFQAQFTGADGEYDHDDDNTNDAVQARWQFRVYTETTEPGVDGTVGTGNDDGDVRRSAASGTATSTAAMRPTPDPLGEPTLLASGAGNAAGDAREGEIAVCIAPSEEDLAQAYRIDASDDGGFNWKPLRQDTRGTLFGECGDNSRPYTDDGLGDDAARTYRAFAIGGPSSAHATGMTAASEAPGKVAGLSVTIPDLDTIEATWTALTGDETGGQPIVEYRLQYTQDDDDDVLEDTDWTDALPILPTTDDDAMETWKPAAPLEENKNYYARIIAVNRVGPDATDALRPETGQTAETTALAAAEVVPFSTGEAAPPNEPEGLTSEQATNRTGELLRGVDLRWNKPSDGPAVGFYEIQRKIGDGEWEAPTTDSVNWRPTLTLYTDPRPYVSGEMLAYQVRAKNDDGESEWVYVDYPRHPPAGDHPHGPVMVAAPTGFKVVKGSEGNTVLLEWTAGVDVQPTTGLPAPASTTDDTLDLDNSFWQAPDSEQPCRAGHVWQGRWQIPVPGDRGAA